MSKTVRVGYLLLVIMATVSMGACKEVVPQQEVDSSAYIVDETQNVANQYNLISYEQSSALKQKDLEVLCNELYLKNNSLFTASFTLQNNKGNEKKFEVEGLYARGIYSEGNEVLEFTWGGIATQNADEILVYSGNTIRFVHGNTLEETKPPLQLQLPMGSQLIGLSSIKNGYLAAIASEEESLLCYFNEAGRVTKTINLQQPHYFRYSNINYFTGKELYTEGTAYYTYPNLQHLSCDSPQREYIVLTESYGSAWVSEDGRGYLKTLKVVDTTTGEIYSMNECSYHIEGGNCYVLMNYFSVFHPQDMGYMGAYYEGNTLKKLFMFPAQTSGYVANDLNEVEWELDKGVATIDFKGFAQKVKLNFNTLKGSAEFHFTKDMLEEFAYYTVYATSPNGRYSLHGININGAGEGYWGQVVLYDNVEERITYVRELPVYYSNDENALNFVDDTYFTAVEVNCINIHTVEEPSQYTTVVLNLPKERENILYCNSMYDRASGRYFLAYLQNVDLDSSGWHGYENASYYVAVFDENLELIHDMAVPELEIYYHKYAMPCPNLTLNGDVFMIDGVAVAIPNT